MLGMIEIKLIKMKKKLLILLTLLIVSCGKDKDAEPMCTQLDRVIDAEVQSFTVNTPGQEYDFTSFGEKTLLSITYNSFIITRINRGWETVIAHFLLERNNGCIDNIALTRIEFSNQEFEIIELGEGKDTITVVMKSKSQDITYTTVYKKD